jgi:hypothetical protein
MRQNKKHTKTLTKRDLTNIRGILPQNWRLKMAETHSTLTLRHITEVFNLRSKNPESVRLVWGTINEALNQAGAAELADRVQNHISFCTALDNVIQK